MFGYIAQKLDESMNIRNTWFQRAKKSLTLRTKLYFMNNLAARNYSGKLNVSHKNETIEPTVWICQFQFYTLLCEMVMYKYRG